jgi:protein involved in polysaccharide export with SLBB domain
MEAGEGRSSRGRSVRVGWGFLLGLVAGCATGQVHLDQALMAERGPAEGVAAAYTVACPDVLDVAVARRPDLAGPKRVDPDGCIKMGNHGRVRVEGQTVAAVAREIATQCGVASAGVQVRVAEYRSQQLYLIGQVAGLQRAVAYQGPETVLDLLQRVGGVTSGAAVNDVYVVRSRVSEGQQPEVFRVNLPAIVLRHDPSTNVRLQPFDQVFVGESRWCCFKKCIPPWLRPLYDRLCGMRREGES